MRENLRKFISKGELIGQQGQGRRHDPAPQIHLPRFRFRPGQEKRRRQRRGQAGRRRDGGDGEGEEGPGKAGDKPGEHSLEVD